MDFDLWLEMDLMDLTVFWVFSAVESISFSAGVCGVASADAFTAAPPCFSNVLAIVDFAIVDD